VLQISTIADAVSHRSRQRGEGDTDQQAETFRGQQRVQAAALLYFAPWIYDMLRVWVGCVVRRCIQYHTDLRAYSKFFDPAFGAFTCLLEASATMICAHGDGGCTLLATVDGRRRTEGVEWSLAIDMGLCTLTHRHQLHKAMLGHKDEIASNQAPKKSVILPRDYGGSGPGLLYKQAIYVVKPCEVGKQWSGRRRDEDGE
jgi:hypothetical protein